VSVTAAAHGYFRAGFYLVAAGFEQAGMSGLLDDNRAGGRHAHRRDRGVVAGRAASPVGRSADR
jgi:hypothetical protein